VTALGMWKVWLVRKIWDQHYILWFPIVFWKSSTIGYRKNNFHSVAKTISGTNTRYNIILNKGRYEISVGWGWGGDDHKEQGANEIIESHTVVIQCSLKTSTAGTTTCAFHFEPSLFRICRSDNLKWPTRTLCFLPSISTFCNAFRTHQFLR